MNLNHWLTQFIGLKFVALFIAVLLWAYNVSEQKEEGVITIQIEIEKPDDVIITNKFDDHVVVNIWGQRGRIRRLTSMPHKILLDVSEFKKGIVSYQIKKSDILVDDVRIVDISPQSLIFNIDYIRERSVPVKSNFIGTLPAGYKISHYEIVPNQANLKGPENQLALISNVFLEELSLENRTSSFNEVLGLNIPFDGIIDISNEAFTLSTTIEPIIVERKLYNIPIRLTGKEKNSIGDIFPESLTSIIIRGPETLLNKLKKNDISVWQNISKKNLENQMLPIQTSDFKLPPGVELLSYQPREVRVIR